jgi:hypothetical protein
MPKQVSLELKNQVDHLRRLKPPTFIPPPQKPLKVTTEVEYLAQSSDTCMDFSRLESILNGIPSQSLTVEVDIKCESCGSPVSTCCDKPVYTNITLYRIVEVTNPDYASQMEQYQEQKIAHAKYVKEERAYQKAIKQARQAKLEVSEHALYERLKAKYE